MSVWGATVRDFIHDTARDEKAILILTHSWKPLQSGSAHIKGESFITDLEFHSIPMFSNLKDDRAALTIVSVFDNVRHQF